MSEASQKLKYVNTKKNFIKIFEYFPIACMLLLCQLLLKIICVSIYRCHVLIITSVHSPYKEEAVSHYFC